MKPTRTWIVLANGGEAKILLNEGLNDGVQQVEGMTFENPHLPAREIMADKPGRSYDSVGGGRHAMEYTLDVVEEAETRFAKSLAGTLQSALQSKQFDRLAIVAAPSMLAHLRKQFSAAVAKTVSAEVDKDYTKIATIKLADALRKAGAIA